MSWRYGPAMAGANAVGAVVVFVFLTFLLPVFGEHQGDPDQQRRVNGAAFAAFLPLSLLLGRLWGQHVDRPLALWLHGGNDPGPVEREVGLTLPWLQARVHLALWALAAGTFGLLNTAYSVPLALEVAGTVLLGGLTTSALGYLVAERILRPVVVVLMAGSLEAPRQVLSLRGRVLIAWSLGTGVPLLGIALGTLQIGERPPLPRSAQLFLTLMAAVVGALAILAASGAVSDPVRSVADGLRRVGEGDLDVAVPVYDASEVGQLQSGFNTMVQGLRDRERLRDLFGRQVGPDVARLAEEQGVQLGGERRDVAVLFVDVIGSTGLAESLGPEELVARLNEFFGVVVEVVTRHAGWVNKFEGDAALILFGAPAELRDARTSCLEAARELASALETLALDAAVGVSSGPVVAGHVGAVSRFEYTVIGDPVNSAARLTELAKATPGRLLADDETVAGSSAQEQTRWITGDQVLLRGRSTPTRTWYQA
jgi:adenylate cyclase